MKPNLATWATIFVAMKLPDSHLTKKTLNADHADIDVLHANLDVADNQPTIILCPGWGETLDTMHYSFKVFAKLGLPIIALDYPMPNNRSRKSGAYSHRSDILINVIKHFDIDKVDCITHSEGSISAAIAARTEPGLFRSITMINPAGIVGYRSMFMLMVKVIRKAVTDGFRALPNKYSRRIFIKHTYNAAEYFFRNTKKAWIEGREFIGVSIVESLEHLSDSDVHTSVIVGKRDKLISSKIIKDKVKDGCIDKFILNNGWHDELHYSPNKYSDYFTKIINSLEAN